jgi:hypothetical protein
MLGRRIEVPPRMRLELRWLEAAGAVVARGGRSGGFWGRAGPAVVGGVQTGGGWRRPEHGGSRRRRERHAWESEGIQSWASRAWRSAAAKKAWLMGCDVVHAAQVAHQLMARLASMGTCVLRIPKRNEEHIKLCDIVRPCYLSLPTRCPRRSSGSVTSGPLIPLLNKTKLTILTAIFP